VTAFIPIVASFLAQAVAPSKQAMPALSASYVTRALAFFNGGGLVGSVAAAPLAQRLGRRRMYLVYFGWSAITVAACFGLAMSPDARLAALAIVGLSVYGIFATFQFYFPELYPTHLRGLGAGFCLNTGRFLTVAGPFAVGALVQKGVSPLAVLPWVAAVPAVGVVMLLLGVGAETRDEPLA
jgi:MFS family permease